MLKTRLIHPEILRALAGAGHGSRVLIADGNYPAATHRAPNATLVYLNLSPGVVTVPEVLEALAATIPIEAAHVMQPADGSTPAIFQEFTRYLPEGMHLQLLERFAFYEAASQSSVCLVIATGEQRIYANLLLTLGVVPPPVT
ncbi:MAG: RbsD/FucU family protein [Chloroherpetonaceae bacterium]|nr:RbsD/FucU family protein [Chthonomonadaceae bacterium]MDW8209032.1 RbsD/FucU family protein [Chloroherpetonaceae bacterium]